MPSGEEEQRGTERLGSVLLRKYTLERVIGSGGMAVVYAGTHRNKNRVAVKVLHQELSARKDLRERFLREGYVANTVDHPGAVAVLDDDTAEDGSAFLVMELLQGMTVEAAQDAHQGRLDAPTVLAIARQLLDVLASAHAHSIVHRDIKPANLFLTREGALKVLDFGIARVREAAGHERSTTTGNVFGTPAFMAPEQAAGRASLIDPRTDIWAVGATMFTLMSGQQVHSGETPQHVALLAATTPARSLADVVPGVDPRVAAVVDRALAFAQEGRWQSAASMRDAAADAYQAIVGEPIGPSALLPALGELERGALQGPLSRNPGGTGALAAPFAPTLSSDAGLPRPGGSDAGARAPGVNRAGMTAGTGMTTEQPVAGLPSKRRLPLALGALAAVAAVVAATVLLGQPRRPATGPAAPPASAAAPAAPRSEAPEPQGPAAEPPPTGAPAPDTTHTAATPSLEPATSSHTTGPGRPAGRLPAGATSAARQAPSSSDAGAAKPGHGDWNMQ